MGGDGGRAEIDRQPVNRAVVIPRPQVHDARQVGVVAQMHRAGDLPRALAQDWLQGMQDVQIGANAAHLPLVVQRRDQPFKITGRFVHVGLVDLDVIKMHRGAHHDVAHLGAFAHDLFVNLGFRRHVDHHIALHLRLTAQAATFDQPALGFIAFLDRVPWAERVLCHAHRVFRKLAKSRGDLAARTNAAPAANAVQINAQLTRRGQDRRAGLKPAALARRGENDKGVVLLAHVPGCICIVFILLAEYRRVVK